MLLYINIILAIIICLASFFVPTIDINFSKTFYDSILGFHYSKNLAVKTINNFVPTFNAIWAIFLIIYILCLKFKSNLKLILNLKNILPIAMASYLLVALILGPGIAVAFFKENWGRARPIHVNIFNGDKEFTKVFVLSNQCNAHCSFPSGHPSVLYHLCSLMYFCKKRNKMPIFLTFWSLGTIVGFCRIIAGKHFLSDVASCSLIVLTINHILYLLWNSRINKHTNPFVLENTQQ